MFLGRIRETAYRTYLLWCDVTIDGHILTHVTTQDVKESIYKSEWPVIRIYFFCQGNLTRSYHEQVVWSLQAPGL